MLPHDNPLGNLDPSRKRRHACGDRLGTAVSVVQSPFGALLMPAVAVAALLAARFVPATLAAIALATPAATADPKDRAAAGRVAELLVKVDLVFSRHWPAKAGLLDKCARL